MRTIQQEIDHSNNLAGWADVAQSLVPVLSKGVDKVGQKSSQEHESKIALLNLAGKRYDTNAAPASSAREADVEKKDDKKKKDNTGTILLIVGVLLLLVVGFLMMKKK